MGLRSLILVTNSPQDTVHVSAVPFGVDEAVGLPGHRKSEILDLWEAHLCEPV